MIHKRTALENATTEDPTDQEGSERPRRVHLTASVLVLWVTGRENAFKDTPCVLPDAAMILKGSSPVDALRYVYGVVYGGVIVPYM